MHLQVEQSVRAPIAEVFRFFSDPNNRPLWQRSLKSVSVDSPGKPRKETRWRESPLGLGEVTMEITVYEPPTRWAERGSSKYGRLDLSMTFQAQGTATRVLVDAELRATHWLAWAVRLSRPLILRELSHDLRRASEILESRAPAPDRKNQTR